VNNCLRFTSVAACVVTISLGVFFSAASFALQAVPVTGKITLDGKLDEPDWQRAPVSANFTENMPREKQPARDRTEVRVLYDSEAIYFGVRGFDPEPSQIHAPFVRRDKVFGNQDNFILWIDPTGAKKFAQFFRVNPRGVVADGVWNEDNSDEDWSPDFDFEAVPARLVDGWSAEFRIPWASLRLPHPTPEKLNFIVFRNQPRETRIRTTNVVLGRDPSCFLCVAEELTGLHDLPKTSGLTVTPYVAVNSSRARVGEQTSSETKFSAGADIKWRPSPEWVLDATFRPPMRAIRAAQRAPLRGCAFRLLRVRATAVWAHCCQIELTTMAPPIARRQSTDCSALTMSPVFVRSCSQAAPTIMS